MSAVSPDIWQFGEFRLDVRRKVLWHSDEAVSMPLKELEVLSMLVRNQGELVTKDELLTEIWEDSFVEESNLSRHIYLLRKTLKDFGATDGLIQNVPRRGYRFTGEARGIEAADIVLEKHTRTRTLIEFPDSPALATPTSTWWTNRYRLGYAALVVLLAAASAFFGSQYLGSEAPDPEIRSMAVLPFKTFGPDADSSHVGSGLADILTTRLSNIKEVKIRPSSATAAAVDQDDAIAAGARLKVDAVLEGTIYYVGDRVRVTARLVRIRDASVAWSGEFEKLRKDEMQLQNDLALQIVPALAVNLSGGERDALDKHYTKNADAYALYLRGRYEWNKRSTPGMIEAQRLFRNAIEADPSFSLAYIGLADTLLTNQPSAGEAWLLISKALELDPNLAEAYASRGFHLMFLQWKWDEAEESFIRSLELNPNYATAHHWYATLLAIKGDPSGAKVEMNRALELNPLSYNFLADLGQLHYFAGEYSEAEQYCLKALEIYPDFVFAHEYLHYIHLQTGDFAAAVAELERADEINDGYQHTTPVKSANRLNAVAAFHQSGIRDYFEHHYPGAPVEPSSFYLYAKKYAFLGENEKALEYLEKAAHRKQFLSAFVKADPLFERLYSEPRYKKILRQMGLS